MYKCKREYLSPVRLRPICIRQHIHRGSKLYLHEFDQENMARHSLSNRNVSTNKTTHRNYWNKILYFCFDRCFVLITGSISDRIGRRRMIQLLTVGLFILTLVTQLLMQFVDMNFETKSVSLIGLYLN